MVRRLRLLRIGAGALLVGLVCIVSGIVDLVVVGFGAVLLAMLLWAVGLFAIAVGAMALWKSATPRGL